MDDIRMEAEIIFESHLPNALRRALEYAGDDGFVASIPQLLHARANVSYDNEIWNGWFTSYSEESVAATPQGHRVVVAVHGGGIFASPERFEQTYRMGSAGSTGQYTGQYAGKISEREAHDLLGGKLPDGAEIPIFPFDEFKRGVADLPRRYAVVMDFETVRKSKSGYETFDILKDEPLMIVRAGGVEPLAAYLDKAKARHDTAVMGNWNPFWRIDPDEPQARMVFLAGNVGGTDTEDDDSHLRGYDSEYGMGGDAGIHNMGRYVAVAPRNVSANLRYLDFEA